MAETIRASLKTSLADLYNKAGSSLGFGAKGIPKASDHVDVGNKIGVIIFADWAVDSFFRVHITTVIAFAPWPRNGFDRAKR